jgi:hypothetical protein
MFLDKQIRQKYSLASGTLRKVRCICKSSPTIFNMSDDSYKLLTTIILYLLCVIVFLLNFISELLTLVLLHLLLCLLLSFLKKLEHISFIPPFLLTIFPLLLDGFTGTRLGYGLSSHQSFSFILFLFIQLLFFICNSKMCLRISCHHSMFNFYIHLRSTPFHHQSWAEIQLGEKETG